MDCSVDQPPPLESEVELGVQQRLSAVTAVGALPPGSQPAVTPHYMYTLSRTMKSLPPSHSV